MMAIEDCYPNFPDHFTANNDCWKQGYMPKYSFKRR